MNVRAELIKRKGILQKGFFSRKIILGIFFIFCFDTVLAEETFLYPPVIALGKPPADAFTVIALGYFSTPADENAVIRQGNYREGHCLDPDQIRIISWNIGKGLKGQTSDSLKNELSKVSPEIDLLILQEASSSEALYQRLSESWRNFGMTMVVAFEDMVTGEKYGSALISKTKPSPSSFGFRRSRSFDFIIVPQKITVFARFCLAGRDEELLVVNMHSLNFTLKEISNLFLLLYQKGPQFLPFSFTEVSEFIKGAPPKLYQNQLEVLGEILRAHKGPVIFAGDMNTWHEQRDEILRGFVDALDLEEVILENSEERIFPFVGFPMDYIFVRGLLWRSAQVLSDWKGSDHYPLFADLFVIDSKRDTSRKEEYVSSHHPSKSFDR